MRQVTNECPACGGRFVFLERDIGLPSNCPHCKFDVLLQPPPQAGGIFGAFFKRLFVGPHKPQAHQPSPPLLERPEANEVPSTARSVNAPPLRAPSPEAKKTLSLAAGKRDLILALEPMIPKHFQEGDRSLISREFKDADMAHKAVETFCDSGAFNYRCSDRGAAIFYFICAVEIDPNCFEAWHNIGVALNDLRDYDRALQAFSFALEANPKHAVSWLDLGTLHLSKKRYREAVDAFRHSTEIQPTSLEAWTGLGTALSRFMQVAEANEAFRRAVELKPDDVRSWKELAMGLALESKYDAALEATQTALQLTPDDTELQTFRSNLMNRSSRESFFGRLRYHVWKEYLERERDIKLS